MTSIGETLRRERLKSGRNLEQVSQETKISTRMLELIENEQFDKLPGGVFTKSFVRQYARALGLDGDELAAEVQRVLQPAAEPQTAGREPARVDFSLPRVPDWDRELRPSDSSSLLPALAAMVLVMIICSLVYTWWQRSRRPAATSEATAIAANVPPPGALAPAARSVPAPPAQTPQPAAETAMQQPGAAPAQSVPAPGSQEPEVRVDSVRPEASRTTPEPGAGPPSPAAPSSAASEASTATIGNGNMMLTLAASELVWVSVSSQGKVLYSGTLKPSQTRVIGGNDQLKLTVGNAGGIQASLNGKPLGPLGPKGQVRVLQLTPAGVQIVPRKPPVMSDPLG